MRVHYLNVSEAIMLRAISAINAHVGNQEIEIYVNPTRCMNMWLTEDFVEDKSLLLKLMVPWAAHLTQKDIMEVTAYKKVIHNNKPMYKLYVKPLTMRRLRELTDMFGDLRLKPAQLLNLKQVSNPLQIPTVEGLSFNVAIER